MALPTNTLQNVETYNDAGLALLLNSFVYINKSNKKFKDFDKMSANLGDTVTYDTPPRYTTNPSLVATFQPSTQLKRSLTVDQAENTSYAFSAKQFTFNTRDYMEKFGKSAFEELGTKVESNVALNNISNTYRFFGDGTTAIDSFGQLARAAKLFRNYGAAPGRLCGILEDVAVADIVETGLQQFVPTRNEDIANSWELGSFSKTDWYETNLLPQHDAGTVGNTALTLTVTAFTTDADGGISDITFSGGGTDADAIKQYDLLQFDDGVSGQTNVRYRTYIGHVPCVNPVQVQATADAASAADSVIIPIFPKLYSAAGPNQNITTAIAVGMQVTVAPSHRAGLLYGGDALYLAMPQLPDEVPFPTATTSDAESGASMRTYYGSKFGLNERGVVHDCIWGSDLVPEYSMRILFPL
jgi:hypothetical protein